MAAREDGPIDSPLSDCPSGSSFYRCSLSDFSGCCSVDPCSMTDGCPDEDDSDDKDPVDDAAGSPTATTPPGPLPTHGVWTSLPPTTDDQSTTRALTTASTETTEATQTTEITESGAVLPTDLGDKSRDSDDNGDGGGRGGGLPPGAIAGIVSGILVALLVLVVLVCLRRRRKRKVTAAHAVNIVPPPMDANDEKFLRSTDPSSAVTTTGSHGDVFTAASSDGKFPSPAPTPSTLGGDPRHSAAAHSYVSSITTAAGSPPPGALSFPAGVAHAGHGPALAEMDSVGTMRLSELPGPEPMRLSELPGPEPTPPSELPAGPAPVRGAGPGGPPGGLATVAENEPRSAGGLLRGTLNPTAGERSRQTYVTSWSQFERDSR